MKKAQILVIEDDVLLSDLAAALLRQSGFKAICFSRGEEALKYLKHGLADLVVLDLLLPGMDGYAVLRKIRAIPKTKNIPVIMLTGIDSQAGKVKGLNAGVDDYITKPYDPEEFVARVKAVLKRAKPAALPIKSVKKILITGGAGFIGSALTRRLLEKNYQVTVIDDFSTGRKENIKDFVAHKNYHLVTGSITDETIVAKAVEECDLIYHLAATVGVKNVVDKPLETIIYDTIGTSIVLKYASAKCVKTFLTSTSEVYGKSEKFPFKEDQDVVLGPPEINRWSYACSKLLDEFFVIGYHRQRGLPVVIVRLFNVVGPGQLGRYGMVIPRFFKMALTGEPITVYGDGKQVRSFTYVDDAIEVMMKLAETPKANGQVINLGSGNQISILDLARQIKRITKSPSKIVFEPYQKYYGKSFQDIRKRVPSLTKLNKIAGFTPKTTLKEILTKTYDYFIRHPEELKRI